MTISETSGKGRTERKASKAVRKRLLSAVISGNLQNGIPSLVFCCKARSFSIIVEKKTLGLTPGTPDEK